MRSPIRAVAAALAGLVLSAGGLARADEASGTWTGLLELRANYYWETSTRVVAPELRLRLDSPDGTRIEANYLVDAITSASIAAGVQEDIRFTEVRNQGTLGLSRELDLGDAQLRLGTTGRLSHEPDYLATGITAYGALSLFRRNTVLGFSLTYIHDHVGAVLRGGEPRVDPETGRNLSDRGRQGTLEGAALGVSWSQNLSRLSTLVVGYQLLHNWGFLQNPYRRVPLETGAGPPEDHPNRRTRHTAYARLAFFVPQSQTAFHLLGRVYADDWSIRAVTPELRVYQLLGPSFLLRLRYRAHVQSASFFVPQGGQTYTSLDPGQAATADGKMSGQNGHLLGVQARMALRFLERTPLAVLERGWVDLSFSVWLRDYDFDAFGWGRDAVLVQAGLRTPF